MQVDVTDRTGSKTWETGRYCTRQTRLAQQHPHRPECWTTTELSEDMKCCGYISKPIISWRPVRSLFSGLVNLDTADLLYIIIVYIWLTHLWDSIFVKYLPEVPIFTSWGFPEFERRHKGVFVRQPLSKHVSVEWRHVVTANVQRDDCKYKAMEKTSNQTVLYRCYYLKTFFIAY